MHFFIFIFFYRRTKTVLAKIFFSKALLLRKNMIKIITKYWKNAKFWKREKSWITKNIFSCLLNWILGHLQSSDDENKIAIREISLRAIQKLSCCDQQTIVDGSNFNLTNGKISFISHYFFVHSIFAKISLFFFNFDWFILIERSISLI